MKQQIEKLIAAALDKLREDGQLTTPNPSIQVDTAKDKQHGDFASNIALL
jgi:arginyl-tRNA synthetase